MKNLSFYKAAALALFLGLGGLTLAACSTPQTATYPDITFNHLKPINMAVGSIRVVDAYQAPLTGDHVEHRFPQPPEKALKRWAHDRINPVGGDMIARFTIEKAGVKEIRLETDKTLKAKFTTEQSEKYESTLWAKLEIVDQLGNVHGQSLAEVSRSQTVPEDATLQEREKVWFEFTEKMMTDFNAHMEKNIRAHLQRWVQ